MNNKWNPFGDLAALQDRMNSLLKEALSAASLVNDQRGLSWSPPMDFFETNEAYEIVAEIPGLDHDQIDLKIEENIVSISGKRSLRVDEGTYFRRERSMGEFVREFSMPTSVCLLYTSPSPRDRTRSRMPSSA